MHQKGFKKPTHLYYLNIDSRHIPNSPNISWLAKKLPICASRITLKIIFRFQLVALYYLSYRNVHQDE